MKIKKLNYENQEEENNNLISHDIELNYEELILISEILDKSFRLYRKSFSNDSFIKSDQFESDNNLFYSIQESFNYMIDDYDNDRRLFSIKNEIYDLENEINDLEIEKEKREIKKK